MSEHTPSGLTTGRSPRRATTKAPTTRRPRRVGRLAAGLVLTAFAILGPAAPAAADGHPPVDLAAVDHLVGDELAAASIPGAAIAITRGTEVVHVRGYGHNADDVPVTANSRFRIASLSKSFTSLAVLQLVDAGQVSLDDRVVAHLPEFRLADPRGADITVRQLLNHTSGLADREVRDLSRPQPRTLAEAATSLSPAHLVAAPGTRFNYHNPNYQLAARLVEVAQRPAVRRLPAGARLSARRHVRQPDDLHRRRARPGPGRRTRDRLRTPDCRFGSRHLRAWVR